MAKYRLLTHESGEKKRYYAISDKINEFGKKSSDSIPLGNYKKLKAEYPDLDPDVAAAKLVENLNIKVEEEKAQEFNNRLINVASVYLYPIYKSLGLESVCDQIKSKSRFKYDLNSILFDLVVNRVIDPSSKNKFFDNKEFIFNNGEYEKDDIYKALKVLANNSTLIQEEMYKNSLKVTDRKDSVLYYDCTNFYFEIDQEDTIIDENDSVKKGLRTYGKEKKGIKRPIVQLGLFMDGDGLPLAYNINSGCTNEQVTLKPELERIIDDYGLEKFIVCTDAGLSSADNRDFNSRGNRSFITTIPLKSLRAEESWALNPEGWRKAGAEDDKRYNIQNLIDLAKENPSLAKKSKHYNTIFYKKAPVNNDKIKSEQFYIVTFCLKYAAMSRHSITRSIDIASSIVNNPNSAKGFIKNDVKKLLNKNIVDLETGEIQEKKEVFYTFNQDALDEMTKYHGFYVVATNLDDKIENITKITKGRWEIEETFRILKTSFEARPVFLSTEEGIKGHFLMCYVTITIVRMLERILNYEFTTDEIVDCLRKLIMFSKNDVNCDHAFDKNNKVYQQMTKSFGFTVTDKTMSFAKLKQLTRSIKFIKIHKDARFQLNKNKIERPRKKITEK